MGSLLIGWEHQGRSTFLLGRNLSETQMIAAARAVLRSGDDEPPLDGLEQVDQAVGPDGVGSFWVVSVNLRNPSLEVGASYTMVPSGFGGDNLNFVPTPVSVPGQRLPLVSLRSPADEGEPDASNYFGRWPGANVTISSTCNYCGQPSSAEPADPAVAAMANQQSNDAQLRAIIASLRPADAATWKAFVRAHPGDPELAVDSLGGLNTPGRATPDGD